MVNVWPAAATRSAFFYFVFLLSFTRACLHLERPPPPPTNHLHLKRIRGFRFIAEFVLKLRPVVVRDYVQHDVNLRPLIALMAKDALLASFGNSTWDAAEVACVCGWGR